jgi:alpha-glucosidase
MSCQRSFLGFGAQYNATDQRGEAFDLFVEEQGIGRTGGLPLMGNAHSTYFPVPYWLDARGFGVALETEARVSVDVCADDMEVMRVEVHSAQAADLVLLHGPSARDVIREVGDHFGRSQSPPAWGFGPWVGIQGGTDDVLAEADALEAAQVPFTALWAQDWTGKREFVTSGEDVGVQYRWTADDVLYPDLAGMIETLHGRGIRFLGYANPFVQLDLPDHAADMIAQGLVALDSDGAPYEFTSPAASRAVSPDFTNPATGEYIKGFLRAMITTYGMDGWMADFGEWAPIDAVLSTGRDPMLAHNTFPTEWHRLSARCFEEERPDGDWAVFTRSGWAGEQGVAQIVWIGDQEADFLPRRPAHGGARHDQPGPHGHALRHARHRGLQRRAQHQGALAALVRAGRVHAHHAHARGPQALAQLELGRAFRPQAAGWASSVAGLPGPLGSWPGPARP